MPQHAFALVNQAADAGLDGIDLNADERVLTPALVAYARSKQLEVLSWVYPGQQETPRLFAALARAGVLAHTSDLPATLTAWQKLT